MPFTNINLEKNKLNIGLLINDVNKPYQNSIYKKILHYINNLNYNLILFSTDKIISKENSNEKILNLIQKLPVFKNIDGIIISINSFDETFDFQSLNEFIKSNSQIPMVCISHKVENISSIIVDYHKGIKELIDHLLFKHKYKNFVFIKGPENNFNAAEKYKTFIEILKKNKIKINNELILNGDLSFQSGYTAVENLLSKKIYFDVIIAANELMTLGAFEALNKNGILIPTNKVIIGFDDLGSDWFLMHQITTIKNPISEQIKNAVSILINKIFNKKTPKLIKIPTTISIKESCGCLSNIESAEKEIKQKIMGELTDSINKLRKSMVNFIQTLSHTIEARDPYTAGHQKRVSNIARCIAQYLNLSPEQIESVRMAALIHDLGKIFIPAEILNKPGKLRSNEFNLIKDHPKLGYEILKDIDFPWPIANIILQHHEKIDGSGYPKGLNNREIMIEAKIICVADVVEAISSHRPHRPSLGIEVAINEIKKNRGKEYDKQVVNACIELFNDKIIE
jgi:putative nucleotidyltransferase with HDIG domain